MRFMDAKLHADIVPTRFSRWLDSARSVASRAMIFSRKSPFHDELKLQLNSFPTTAPALSQKHRESPMAKAVEHMTSAS